MKCPATKNVPEIKKFAVQVPPRGTVKGPGPSTSGKAGKSAACGVLSNSKFNVR
jgi:hypothetical protein